MRFDDTSKEVRQHRARLAQASRYGNEQAATAAKQGLKGAQLCRAIEDALATAPPLTDRQRQGLAKLLWSGGESR